MEEGKSVFKILRGKPTGKRPLGRPRRRWEANIRMDFKELCVNTRNWVDSSQDRNYWRAKCEIEPPGPINYGVILYRHTNLLRFCKES